MIYFNDSLNIAQKCTFCAHLLDDGWSEPRCVDACPTGAFTFGEEEDLKELIAKAEPLKPGLDVKPRVYYIGLPKPFIAGAVFQPETDECTEGATVVATNLASGATAKATTDGFGDFWLNDLAPGQYTLSIEKPGFLRQKMGPIDAEQGRERGRHRASGRRRGRRGAAEPGAAASCRPRIRPARRRSRPPRRRRSAAGATTAKPARPRCAATSSPEPRARVESVRKR